MRKKSIMGNWKLNPVKSTEVQHLATLITDGVSQLAQESNQVFDAVNIVIAPSFIHIPVLANVVNDYISMMAQDVSIQQQKTGAFTGDVSAAQLKASGVGYVLVGHSERRQYQSESTETLINKVQASLKQGLHVVFCVGENAEQRKLSQHLNVIEQQLNDVLQAVLAHDDLEVDNLADLLTIAYEPVWAIGTGLTANNTDIEQMHAHIRKVLSALSGKFERVSILYGGSVKASNAPQIAQCNHVDGVLVGGASLVPEQFLDIIKSFS